MKMVQLPILVKNMETKNSIRKQMLMLRNAMTQEEGVQKSRQIARNVWNLPEIFDAEYILCYASYKSEVMMQELVEELLRMKKQIWLPRVSGEEMEFYRITSLLDLSEGYKGILEPSVKCTDVFTKETWEQNKEKVVMLLPGVAFSETGARIGYGKGYYDRYLNRIPCKVRIALCYELQMTEHIPADVHDIPVTIIVTEEKVRHIIGSKSSTHLYI